MVTLPFRLGGIIRDAIDSYRKKNNIPEPEEVKKLSVYRKRDTFLESEFDLVKEISIDKSTLEYLHYFPQLTSITINGVAGINQFELAKIIKNYPNLTHLTIDAQKDLQYLDVSGLKKLEELKIVSNKALHMVKGLSELENLKRLSFYDNDTYSKVPELCEIIREMSSKGIQCDLDVLYMPKLEELLQQQEFLASRSLVESNITWSETIGFGVEADHIGYSSDEMRQAYEKAQSIVPSLIKPTDTTLEKYAILYQWMCENVRYDYDALDNSGIHRIDGINQGILGGTNGTFNGLVYGSCVCQGYSKAMQLLLQMCNIPSFDVSCYAEMENRRMPSINIDGRVKKTQGDHSILKVNIDGQIYYSDVTWDANRFQNNRQRKYFLLSQSEIKNDHKLVGEEQVLSAFKSIDKEKQQQLFEMAKSRIESAKKQQEAPKTRTEQLQEINRRLISLRTNYGVVGFQIENLMKQNTVTPIANYQEQLENLMKKRDLYQEQISQYMTEEAKITDEINKQKQQRINDSISKVKSLVGIRITDVAGYSVDPNRYGGVPYVELKDSMSLQMEHGEITKKIDELWMNGEIDLKTRQQIQLDITNVYNEMIAKAPKPTMVEQKQQTDEVKKDKSTEELLSDTKTSLSHLSQQYGQVANQIETLMKQNQATPIADYQQQLNRLIQQRDSISAQMTPLMESQRVYHVTIDREREEKHQSTLFQIEQITGTRITDISGYAINPDKYNGVPFEELKDTSQLRKEQGEISAKIDELWMNGDIDPKTRAEMKMALVTEYNKMVAKAPKPSVSQPTPSQTTPSTSADEFEQKQQQFPTSNSPQPQQEKQHQTEKVESIDDEYRRKYNYDSMSDSEKIAFDRRLEEQKRKRRTTFSESDELKREKAKAMEQKRFYIDEQLRQEILNDLNFENIMREQQRLAMEQEEMEEVEDRGMHM